MSEDYYNILGISKNASDEEIKKAYRKLARQHHPDKTGGDEARFKKVNEAYQILSDKTKRAQYDQFGRAFEGAQSSGGFSGSEGFGPFADAFKGARNTGGFEFRAEDLSGFGDIFSDIFGGGKEKTRNRGSDIAVDLEISFEEAGLGAKKSIELYKRVICPECKGSGAKPGSPIEQCSKCKGAGQIKEYKRTILGTITQTRICPDCSGAGKIPKEKCRNCGGDGRVRENKKIEIDIPAGIDNGQAIRVAGQGEAGIKGDTAGDLFITVHIKPHQFFKRQGNDILYETNISFSNASLGTKIEIPTLKEKIMLKIPSGIQSGKLIKIRGKGIPYLNRRGCGDQFVKIIVKIPDRLSWRQKGLLKDLQKEGL